MLPDLSHITSHLASMLPAIALKGALLLAVALAIVAIMHRATAAVRHAVLASALSAALVLPLLIVALPSWHVPVLQTAPVESSTEIFAPAMPAISGVTLSHAPGASGTETSSLDSAAPDMVEHEESVSGSSSLLQGLSSRIPTVSEVRETVFSSASGLSARVPSVLGNWKAMLGLFWLLGVFVVATRWMGAYASARRLLSDATPKKGEEWEQAARRAAADIGLHRTVRLLRSERLAVPVAWSFGRPAVVLPADCDEWTPQRREVVLMHELAHIARHDGTTQLVAQAAVALHWFNPLAWHAYNRFLGEREQACDDLVLAQGARASDYARHLLHVARRYRQDSLALLSVAAMARNADLTDRVEAILDPERRRGDVRRSHVVVLTCLAALLAVPLAAFSPIGSAAPNTVQVSATQINEVVSSEASDDWRWQGTVAAGDLVEIYGLNGAVRVREGDGNTVRVVGTPRGRNAHRTRLEVNDVRGGVVICVIYEGQSGCAAGRGPRGRARNTNNATVNLEVVVPQRVRLQASTTNGAIRTDLLSAAVDVRSTNGAINAGSRTGDVRARTTNGALTLTANGRMEARTTNGSINARFQSTNWRGTSSISATNGSVTVALPGRANVQVDARTTTGAISSSFDAVEVTRRRGPGATAAGTIGSGGRQLEIRTTNGRIRIDRHTGSVGAAPARGTDVNVAVEVREALEAARAEVENIDWQAIRQEVIAAQAQGRAEMERAMAEVERVDWEAAGREARIEIERARAEMEQVDWDAVSQEVRLGLEQARQELEQIDWDEIRSETLAAQETARLEIQRALQELETTDWESLGEGIQSILQEVFRGLATDESDTE